jgi:dTDP-4-amino-4,6-dideoxygalactose transaminase
MDTLDIGPGDEVITTPFTFIASGGAISRSGAVPVFVDIDPQTLNMNVGLVERAITERTKAILPVHLFGQLVDMPALMELAVRYDLPVVEDSAQAIGAAWEGQRACSFGIVAGLSFYPTKNLGAYGDAGMAVTCNPEMACRLDVLRQKGGQRDSHRDRLGYNSRLDELQAAALRVKLQHLDDWTQRRRRIASLYADLLAGAPVMTPFEAPGMHHVYHQYTIRAPKRDELRAYLQDQGIGTRVYYPVPLHLQEIYSTLGLGLGSFPESEQAAREVLSLPIYPELTLDQVETVAGAVRRFYRV